MVALQLNQQLSKISPSPIRSFNDQISDIDGILRLTIGEPDFKTPDFIKQAAIDAIQHDLNGYTHSRGLIELRQEIAHYLKRHYQLNYNPENEIIVTVGATEALLAALLAILNPGDKVVVPSPNYVIYETHVLLAGATLIRHDVSDTNFKLTPDALRQLVQADNQIKVLLLNHPCNPTGVTYTADELESLATVAREFDLWVVSDEIYSELTYHGSHVSMAKFLPERTILINGTSKSHAMTGWRSCFIAAPAQYTNEIFKVHQASVNTPSTQAQYASIAAYRDGDEAIVQMRQGYDERRQYLMQRFADLGYQTLNPDGAFYLFVKVPDWYQGSEFDFCLDLAKQAKVGIVPGSAFGPAGQGYFRLSYAADLSRLEEAMHRIETFTQYLAKGVQ